MCLNVIEICFVGKRIARVESLRKKNGIRSGEPTKVNSVFNERMYFYRNEVEGRYDSYVSLCAEINSNTGTEFYVHSIKERRIYITHS